MAVVDLEARLRNFFEIASDDEIKICRRAYYLDLIFKLCLEDSSVNVLDECQKLIFICRTELCLQRYLLDFTGKLVKLPSMFLCSLTLWEFLLKSQHSDILLRTFMQISSMYPEVFSNSLRNMVAEEADYKSYLEADFWRRLNSIKINLLNFCLSHSHVATPLFYDAFHMFTLTHSHKCTHESTDRFKPLIPLMHEMASSQISADKGFEKFLSEIFVEMDENFVSYITLLTNLYCYPETKICRSNVRASIQLCKDYYSYCTYPDKQLFLTLVRAIIQYLTDRNLFEEDMLTQVKELMEVMIMRFVREDDNASIEDIQNVLEQIDTINVVQEANIADSNETGSLKIVDPWEFAWDINIYQIFRIIKENIHKLTPDSLRQFELNHIAYINTNDESYYPSVVAQLRNLAFYSELQESTVFVEAEKPVNESDDDFERTMESIKCKTENERNDTISSYNEADERKDFKHLVQETVGDCHDLVPLIYQRILSGGYNFVGAEKEYYSYAVASLSFILRNYKMFFIETLKKNLLTDYPTLIMWFYKFVDSHACHNMAEYNQFFYVIWQYIVEENHQRIARKLVKYVPYLPAGFEKQLMYLVLQEETCLWGCGLFQLILQNRSFSPGKNDYLGALLNVGANSTNQLISSNVLSLIEMLFKDGLYTEEVQEFTLNLVGNIMQSDYNTSDTPGVLGLYQIILRNRESSYFNRLAAFYLNGSSDLKLFIIRQMEPETAVHVAINGQFLAFFENIEKGYEPFLLRILHLIVSKATPPAEIINKIKEVYEDGRLDVRFLVPLMKYLSQPEFCKVLPTLICQNEGLIKDFFQNHLLPFLQKSLLAITPYGLVTLLLNLDSKVPAKQIDIALKHCLSYTEIYTQEVVCNIIQKIVDSQDISSLGLKVIVRVLDVYPRINTFVVTCLNKLLKKQVWKHEGLWDDFLSCINKTQPQSYSVIIQLPLKQLSYAFDRHPELRSQLRNYVSTLGMHNQAMISKGVIELCNA